MLSYLLFGVIYGFTAALQPGPFLAYLSGRTVMYGWKQTLPLVFTPLLSDGPVILLVLTLLSGVPEWWIEVLRFAGGGFMMYLGAATCRAVKDGDAEKGSETSGYRHGIFRAAMVNVLNPGPYLFWGLVTGPLLLKAWLESPVNGVALVLGFYLAMIAGLSGVILLFSLAGAFGRRAGRVMLVLSGLAMVILGVYQIVLGLSEIRTVAL